MEILKTAQQNSRRTCLKHEGTSHGEALAFPLKTCRVRYSGRKPSKGRSVQAPPVSSTIAQATQSGCLALADVAPQLPVTSHPISSYSFSPKPSSEAVPPLQLQGYTSLWLILVYWYYWYYHNGRYQISILQVHAWFHLACYSHQIFHPCNRKRFEYSINFSWQCENGLERKPGLPSGDDVSAPVLGPISCYLRKKVILSVRSISFNELKKKIQTITSRTKTTLLGGVVALLRKAGCSGYSGVVL